ncbi:MAG: hypothetical protein WCA49_16260 [Candidatus Sulfotelmatobacter sp.]
MAADVLLRQEPEEEEDEEEEDGKEDDEDDDSEDGYSERARALFRWVNVVLTHFAILQRPKFHTGDWLPDVSRRGDGIHWLPVGHYADLSGDYAGDESRFLGRASDRRHDLYPRVPCCPSIQFTCT